MATRYVIPALERFGTEAVADAMRAAGYGNPERTIRSWIAKRGVPDQARENIRRLAEEKGILLKSSDFDAMPRSCFSEDAAA